MNIKLKIEFTAMTYYTLLLLALIYGGFHHDLSSSLVIEKKLTNIDLTISLDDGFDNSPYFTSKGDLIGKGSFKEVYEISVSHLSTPMALVQPHSKSTDKIKYDLKRELFAQAFLAQQLVPNEYLPSFLKGLKQPRHCLTPQVFFVSLSQSNQSRSFFNFAVVERMEMTLENWANSTEKPLLDVLKYCLEFVDLLITLHEVGLAHGDFHIKNIAIDCLGKLRLIDLGASGPGVPEQRTKDDLPEDTGWDENPAAYFAPEVRRAVQDTLFKGWMARTGFVSDIYSCSYAICEMIIGPKLFMEIEKNEKEHIDHMQFMFKDGESLEHKLQNKLSTNSLLIRLLKNAFSINVINRPTMHELQIGLCNEIIEQSLYPKRNCIDQGFLTRKI